MPIQPFYKVTARGQTPGDLIELRASETSNLLASGTIDADGLYTAQYPARHGPAFAVTRRVTQAQPWIADQPIAAGTLMTSEHFGGKLLKCVISGTTGISAPTDSERLIGNHYTKLAASKYWTGVIRNTNGVYDSLSYRTSAYTTSAYGYPNNWPFERVVEWCASQQGLMALLDDGSVLYSAATSSISTSSPHYWANDAIQTWPKMRKIWPWQYGFIGLGADGSLYTATERFSSTARADLDAWLAANPTAVQFLPGAHDENSLTVILADGTVASRDAQIATETAGITNAAAGAQAYGLNSDRTFIICSKDEQTLWSFGKDGFVTYTSDELDGSDRIIRLHCAYNLIHAQLESGHYYRANGRGGLTTGMHHYLAAGLAAPPNMVQMHGNTWGNNEDTEPCYILTPWGCINTEQATGWPSGLSVGAFQRNQQRLEIDGNPIIFDGDCAHTLIDPPAASSPLIPLLHESIDVDAPLGTDGEISGTLQLNSSAADRQIIALSTGPSPAVIASTRSADTDGSYTLTLPDHTAPVNLLALDDHGDPWIASTAYAPGARVYPNGTHTGLVYQTTAGGTSGGTEPTWPPVVGASVTDNSITWEAFDYYRGEMHGPIVPGAVGAGDEFPDILIDGQLYNHSGSLLIEGIIFDRYSKQGESTTREYRPRDIPADINENLYIYSYARTVTGTINYNIFENTIDSNDKIYRRLDGSSLATFMPLAVALATAGYFPAGEIATHYTVTDAGWVDGFNQAELDVPPSGNTTYAYAGTSDETASMYGRFPLPTELPRSALTGNALKLTWSQSSYAGSDAGGLEIRFLDTNANYTGSAALSGEVATPANVWTERTLTSTAIPADATHYELTWTATRLAGSNNNAYIDAYTLEIVAP